MPRRTINDLPLYSPWPARLLGLEQWSRRSRTREEIDREFEKEKWGGLLRFALRPGPPLTLEAADAWVQGPDTPILCSEGEELVESTASAAHNRYRDLVAEVVARHLPASAVAELGAGYGSIVVDLARRPAFRNVPMFAADISMSGCQVIEMLALTEGLEISTGPCDFVTLPITRLDIPPGAVIYTSHAAQSIPRLMPTFIDGLASLNPSAVIHVEPCYEHSRGKTLLGLLRRRYIEMNDYNTNLITVLHEQRERGTIDIVEERPAVFGSNPLLAASVIVWRPLRRP
jgi:hypothetical protein